MEGDMDETEIGQSEEDEQGFLEAFFVIFVENLLTSSQQSMNQMLWLIKEIQKSSIYGCWHKKGRESAATISQC